MVDNTILSPPSSEDILPDTSNLEEYLKINNCLSEYSKDESYKERVRTNLDVPSLLDKERIEEDIISISSKLKMLLMLLTNIEDPYITNSLLTETLREFGYIKSDGSIPFTKPQKGVTPKSTSDLTTLGYVTDKIKEHSLRKDDPHDTLSLVLDLLDENKYVTSNDVYKKNKVYNKLQIEDLLAQYTKLDGSTPFTKPLIGQYPKFDSHLTTKRYVDEALYNHKLDIDPHGYQLLLNSKLNSYAKIKNVYDKTETYSRVLIQSIIEDLVSECAKDELQDHINQYDPHDIFTKIKKEKYIKANGTTPFMAPQKGVDAIEEDELVTLKQLTDKTSIVKLCEWITSGPVESTVGFVEKNTQLDTTVSVLEILDAIFYGKGVFLTVDEYTTIGTSAEVTMCIHGSLLGIINIELFQNDELIGVYDKELFENGGCLTVDSDLIFEDTKFELRVSYLDGIVHNTFAYTKVAYPIFIGLLPYISFAANITYEYLKDLVRTTNKNLNDFIHNIGNNVKSLLFHYIFEDPKLRKPFIVIPESYPDLESITTVCLTFGIEAFEPPVKLPMYLELADRVVYYKVYVYKQPLVRLNQEVTFNFKELIPDEPIL